MSATKTSSKKSPRELDKRDLTNISLVDHTVVPGADYAIEGHFCEVIRWDDKGAYGVFENVLESGKDGLPNLISIRLRDSTSQTISAKYDDVKRAEAGRR